MLSEPDASSTPPVPEEPVVRQATQVRRVSRADVEELRHWLVGRLAKAAQTYNRDAIYTFLVQALDSNEYLFIRNDRAVAMAAVQSRPLRPLRVTEMFCYAIGYEPDDQSDEPTVFRSEAAQSAATLYPAIKAWAKGLGAAQCYLLDHSDTTPYHVEKVFGALATGKFRWAVV